MKRGLVILLLIFPYVALSHPNLKTDSADEEIIEAVFRYQIKHCYEARSPKLYFLSYREQDLSDSFMARFNHHEPKLRKRSQMFGFKDKATGESGILLAIGNINRISDVKAEVRVSCGAASLDGYSYLNQVERKRGKWIVKRSKLIGIS